MSKKNKVIDYLFEDPEVPHQKFALVSIVGPHMPQECDVWGLKVRGVADTIDKAKAMTQKLMRIDNDYDIYTVEVGKFFPLAIEPNQVGNIEYQNDQLNALVKSYLENREIANQEWNKRKNEMIKEAIKEGKNQEELANKPEHPVAVLQRIKDYEGRITSIKEDLESIMEDLNASKHKFTTYTEEERQLAEDELNSAVKNVVQEHGSGNKDVSIEEVRDKLMSLQPESSDERDPVHNLLEEMKALEEELNELETLRNTVSESTSPAIYKRVNKNITDVQQKIEQTKEKLNNTEMVNKFINSNYKQSQYNYLEENNARN
jgi:chromosome segregation ATPase